MWIVVGAGRCAATEGDWAAVAGVFSFLFPTRWVGLGCYVETAEQGRDASYGGYFTLLIAGKRMPHSVPVLPNGPEHNGVSSQPSRVSVAEIQYYPTPDDHARVD